MHSWCGAQCEIRPIADVFWSEEKRLAASVAPHQPLSLIINNLVS